MLEKQVAQLYEVLTDLVKDNSYMISSQGENPCLAKEDPLAKAEVLANNMRSKLIGAQNDLNRQTFIVGGVQNKLSKKNGKSSRSHSFN